MKANLLYGKEELSIDLPDEIIIHEINKHTMPLLEDVDASVRQALLECLWVFEEQRIVNLDLLKKVFQADEPRVRAAAIRSPGLASESETMPASPSTPGSTRGVSTARSPT